jgi:hypothetical protein
MSLQTIIVKNLTASEIVLGTVTFAVGNNTLFDINVGATYKPARDVLLNHYDEVVNNTISDTPEFEVTVNGIAFTTRYHFGALWDELAPLRKNHEIGFNSIDFCFYFDPEDSTFNVKCPLSGKTFKVQMIERI